MKLRQSVVQCHLWTSPTIISQRIRVVWVPKIPFQARKLGLDLNRKIGVLRLRLAMGWHMGSGEVTVVQNTLGSIVLWKGYSGLLVSRGWLTASRKYKKTCNLFFWVPLFLNWISLITVDIHLDTKVTTLATQNTFKTTCNQLKTISHL